jgi:hypothetical protein
MVLLLRVLEHIGPFGRSLVVRSVEAGARLEGDASQPLVHEDRSWRLGLHMMRGRNLNMPRMTNHYSSKTPLRVLVLILTQTFQSLTVTWLDYSWLPRLVAVVFGLQLCYRINRALGASCWTGIQGDPGSFRNATLLLWLPCLCSHHTAHVTIWCFIPLQLSVLSVCSLYAP